MPLLVRPMSVIHIVVFLSLLSGFYDFPTLRPLAASRFEKLHPERIPLDILKHVYESIPEKDRGMRDVLLRKELGCLIKRAKNAADYVQTMSSTFRILLATCSWGRERRSCAAMIAAAHRQAQQKIDLVSAERGTKATILISQRPRERQNGRQQP